MSTTYLPISAMARGRRKLHMTQEALAEGICSRQSIAKYEIGASAPSERIARKLAKRLHVEPWSLAQAAKYDREQLAAIQKALGEQNYEVMHDMCSEMFNRAKTRLAREHFEHYLQMCEEMMAVTRT